MWDERGVTMSGSGRITRRAEDRRPEDASAAPTSGQVASRPMLDDVDGLLDEIDEVLESNAEEFVRGYVQKGGE
jgi:ubiquitin-like protein Pup